MTSGIVTTECAANNSSFLLPELPSAGKFTPKFMEFSLTSSFALRASAYKSPELEKGDPTAKNRIWGFFGKRKLLPGSQVSKLRQERELLADRRLITLSGFPMRIFF